MINIRNTKIDYSLFDIDEKEYFENSLILPYFEDDISIHFIVCKESKLLDIKSRIKKLVKFKEIKKEDLQFLLSYINEKIELFNLANKAICFNASIDKFVQEFIYTLLSFSIELRASDIHFEQYSESILFRFRIDGRLNTFFTFDIKLFKILSSYLKLLSNLDITQFRLPMDSRFSLIVKNKNYDFRLSTMPTLEAESIVIRILDNKNVSKSLNSLGLSSSIYTEISNSLKLTQGLILITGPTGSGKTTTLYSMLKELKSNEKKVITVEDPIEYKIESISQIQVNNKIGLNFELILKNILRQDPDIIFIGEIRDKFSLDIALQASLTGHLVLASIHANSSIETITRLFDLDADPFLVSSTLKLIISQRLVLSFCKFCDSKGCQKCNYTKYYDRTCIAETLKIDENISSMIFRKEDLNSMKKYLKQINFQTIFDDGINKVNNKETSIEEVYKVINQ